MTLQKLFLTFFNQFIICKLLNDRVGNPPISQPLQK